jgi:hypothetical protein
MLGKSTRTVRRWIADRPDLRRVLRARRNGKRWRIDPPQPADLDGWIKQVRAATEPFTRTPERKGDLVKVAKGVCADLGFGDAAREHDIEILRQAMKLKRVLVERSCEPHAGHEFYAQLDNERSENLPSSDYSEWSENWEYCWSTARRVAARFQCRVQDSPRYWKPFLESCRESRRERNAPEEAWLKEHGPRRRGSRSTVFLKKPSSYCEAIREPLCSHSLARLTRTAASASNCAK